jgi:hypothetical protein
MKYNIKAKSGLIINCENIRTNKFQLNASSKSDFHLYYVDKDNIDHLKKNGEWKNILDIMYMKEDVNKINDIIRQAKKPSYIFLMNSNDKEIDVDFNILEFNESNRFITGDGFGVTGIHLNH